MMHARACQACRKHCNGTVLMSVTLVELSCYLDALLRVEQFQDYCPNGVQVEGRARIERLATGVTACQQVIDEAIAWRADALLVHHGFFWRGEAPQIVGMKRRRIAALLASEMTLLAYHLPLDAHPQLGNNACLGRLLGMQTEAQQPLQPGNPGQVGNIATLPQSVPVAEIVARLATITGREPLHIGEPGAQVQHIAWCTGAAQGHIEVAKQAGAQLFVTGEVSEQTVHFAREENIQFIAAGHHATERYGVQALGEHVAEQFTVEHRFFDVANPV